MSTMFLVIKEEHIEGKYGARVFPEDDSVRLLHLYSSYAEAEKAITEALPYDEDEYEDLDEAPKVVDYFIGDWRYDDMDFENKYPVRYVSYECPYCHKTYAVLFSVVEVPFS